LQQGPEDQPDAQRITNSKFGRAGRHILRQTWHAEVEHLPAALIRAGRRLTRANSGSSSYAVRSIGHGRPTVILFLSTIFSFASPRAFARPRGSLRILPPESLISPLLASWAHGSRYIEQKISFSCGDSRSFTRLLIARGAFRPSLLLPELHFWHRHRRRTSLFASDSEAAS